MTNLIKLVILVFVHLSYCISVCGQIDSSFEFTPINLNLSDTSNLSLMQKQLSFTSKRIYKGKSFIDNHIFCSTNDKICAVEFKIIELNWYIKSGNKWLRFYSNTDHQIQSVKLKKGYYISPIISKNKRNLQHLYGFSIKKKAVNYSETNIFWFNPLMGIVIIENSEFALIRKDYFNQIKSNN